MTTITETVPTFGTPPQTSDPANFDTRADTLLATELPAFVTSMNTLSGQINTVSGEVVTNSATASSAATTASSAATTATSSADAASAIANYAGAWADQTGSAVAGISVDHNGQFWFLLNNLADITASEPSVSADWSSQGRTVIEERTANTIITTIDFGKILKYTSGTFTQTFDTISVLGDGFMITLWNAGTGNITIPLSDGVSSWVMYPNEIRTFIGNGTVLTTIINAPFDTTFTASGTLTTAPHYKAVQGLMWSGGSSGQRTNSVSTASSGGGGGGAFDFYILASDMGATETVTVGAGGAAVTTVANGNLGGDTSIGSLAVVYGPTSDFKLGGSIGLTDSVTSSTLHSHFAMTTQTTPAAYVGVFAGGQSSSNATAPSSGSINGGGGGGSLTTAAAVQAAGTSKNGGSGGAAVSAASGTAGTVPGGGGGATQTGTQSGAGARGEIRIRGVI